MLDRAAWVAFLVILPPLWASGVWLFARSALSPRHKLLWTLFLLAVGAGIGLLLPLAGIRNRFFLLLAVLPVLAVVDVRLARSSRSFLFWLRACAFEICTVFAVAALVRLLRSGF